LKAKTPGVEIADNKVKKSSSSVSVLQGGFELSVSSPKLDLGIGSADAKFTLAKTEAILRLDEEGVNLEVGIAGSTTEVCFETCNAWIEDLCVKACGSVGPQVGYSAKFGESIKSGLKVGMVGGSVDIGLPKVITRPVKKAASAVARGAKATVRWVGSLFD